MSFIEALLEIIRAGTELTNQFGTSELRFLVALYAAILSTVLALREVRKSRKKLRSVLYLSHTRESYLRITNTGHRPITVTGLKVSAVQIVDEDTGRKEEREFGEPCLFKDEIGEDVFPCRLTDGETVRYELDSDVASDLVSDRTDAIMLVLYDAEGKKHRSFNIERHAIGPRWEI